MYPHIINFVCDLPNLLMKPYLSVKLQSVVKESF